MKEKNILVAVGNDDETMNSTVKFWNLDRFDTDGYPELVRLVHMPQGSMVHIHSLPIFRTAVFYLSHTHTRSLSLSLSLYLSLSLSFLFWSVFIYPTERDLPASATDLNVI